MEWKISKFNNLTNDEIYDILKIRIDVFVVEQKCAYPDCDEKDKDAYHLFLKDEKNGNIIAYLRILDKNVSYDEVSIGRFLVNKDYRKRGFAREALERAINFINNTLNETEIRISAQAYLKEFYRSVGFQQVSEVYLEDNIPHIEMILKK